ncbi:sacsin N-terminal ATP-binding-like domain-containing protein [Nocardia sp. XZ_19_385]|uniref:DEAD/DEAH box helicase n=1 Tax=Nocardia sp. XZ_19_385 TaxID=2769488 RepID=UPI0028159885|nr:helicase-related protein [Nocardia sp. XZ_19_385]
MTDEHVRSMWTTDPGLGTEVEELFRRAIAAYRENPHLVAEHANHEESIRIGGYSNRTLLELVQNAADAMAGITEDGPEQGRVEIVLDATHGTLYCANAGRPFSKPGLTAIAHAHISGKRGDEIGRFGLGFKSVLAVSHSPQVFSRSVSFEFNTPESKAAIARVAPNATRQPVLRTATLIDPNAHFASDPILAELAAWAVTIVKLPGTNHVPRLRQEIKDFSSEFLLFVSSVREVKLRILGDEGFETSHSSRNLGGGVFKIERPDGSGDEWIVEDQMHTSSPAARREVGEAVSREKVKVTVAVPRQQRQRRIGQFWSYFPLLDETTASALFNAPWSVNDDRTTLLRNTYNRDILKTLGQMFVDILPRLSSLDDPAAHFDYLPARGKEERSFGDSVLSTQIPRLSAQVALIPDPSGRLRPASELRPLDFTIDIAAKHHQAWTSAPNTGDDVPHWRCYTTDQRKTRLRDLFLAGSDSAAAEFDRQDALRILDKIPKRGLLSWLREWADGDVESAATAFKFVVDNLNLPHIKQAKVIPTDKGLCALIDQSMVFLEQEEDIEIEGSAFVDPGFLASPGIRKNLEQNGFRKLDPLAILTARVAALAKDSDDESQVKFWDAVDGVRTPDAIATLRANPHHAVKVPTRDGGWAWPRHVVAIDEKLGSQHTGILLDPSRCNLDIALELGVVQKPVKDYELADEPLASEYQEWAIKSVNSNLGPGERPVVNVRLYPKANASPGPFSMLLILRDANATPSTRISWTQDILMFGDEDWGCHDADSGTTYPIKSPVRWAVERAGLVNSKHGVRAPHEVVAPSLIKYGALLPLFTGPTAVADVLHLPDELEHVPAQLLRTALGSPMLPPTINDAVLTEFILIACNRAYPKSSAPKVPARVGRALEARSPKTVFVAVTDEQCTFLDERQRPYLRATAEQVEELVDLVGCSRFEDTFAFSMLIEGKQTSERVLDVFTGLRPTTVADLLTNATMTRAERVTKRVTLDTGTEDQSLEWHPLGLELVIQNDVEEARVLDIVNDAFDLRLSNYELMEVRQQGIDDNLDRLRQEAKAAVTDADRLEIYIGDDDLREALPNGLWQALQAQGLVDTSTSVGDLYLTVFGSDSIKQLGPAFQQKGFPDVPSTWAGGTQTISWLRRMGFGSEYAGQRGQSEDAEFVVPGAVILSPLHDFQRDISDKLQEVLTQRDEKGRAAKAMVELPTGAGKTRVAAQTVLEMFIDGRLSGPVLWIAQSKELCEQAVQTWSMVWRGLGDERPLTVGRLWDSNVIHEPDTAFSIIVATDAMLDSVHSRPEYEWLRDASAVIVDEGHRAGDSERYTRLLSWLGVAGHGWMRPLVGLSATPFKGKSAEATQRLAARFGNQILRAFDSNPYKALVDLGVLARVRHQVLDGVDVALTAAQLAKIRSSRLIDPTVLDQIGKDHKRLSIVVDHIMTLDPDWPVLVFTPNVLSAQILAATLRYRKIAAESVSGQTGRQQRRDVIDKFRRGEIRVLTNCDLLIQGFDAPGVRALYIARPTFSPNAYIQMAGRGLRGKANGGKEECLIVDMVDDFGDINSLLGFREYEHLWREQRA